MSLLKSPSAAAIRRNVKTEIMAGRPQKQAVAIAYSIAAAARKKRRGRADG